MFQSVNELRKAMMVEKTKDKFKAGILTMMLAETMSIAKSDGNREPEAKDIQSAIKKMIKMTEQAVAMNVEGSKEELEFLKTFAPKMLSKEETETIVASLIAKHGKNIGAIMKDLKAEYGEILDMKLANEIIKNS